MGTQQILLLVLSLIIISVAIVGEIGLFKLHAVNTNRAAIVQDLHEISLKAIAYYKSPSNMGGGDGNWDTAGFYIWASYPLTDDENRILTGNGEILVNEQTNGNIMVTGWGNETGHDGTNVINVRLILELTSGELTFDILN
ncbi:MAG: hypothetical protein PF570_00975 [Candidatus Cloacimonetes bacterium]|jgi:hypothetical protein|nr:hypothetical protein [Candidatus Cloacimonadota bacterium]